MGKMQSLTTPRMGCMDQNKKAELDSVFSLFSAPTKQTETEKNPHIKKG
jgi:hypothetical protein